MDGTFEQLAANRIALSMYEHVNSEGFTTKILDQVQRHRKTDEAIEKSDRYNKDSKGRRSRTITTKGYYSLYTTLFRSVRKRSGLADADSFSDFDEYIKSITDACKRRRRDGSCKSNQKIPRT